MAKKIDTILSQALAAKGHLSERDIAGYLKESEKTGENLGKLLVRSNAATEQEILSLLAEELKIPFLRLRETPVEKPVIERVPVKIAAYYKFVPVKFEDRLLTLAVSWPIDIKIQDEIRTQLGYDVAVCFATTEDISEALKRYYGLAADTLEGMNEQSGMLPLSSSASEPLEKIEDLEKLAEDASVIHLVNQIILDAFRKRATDIHIEPYRQDLSLRYRIDGILYEANLPGGMRNYINAIISRIKIMSNLNIVEKRLPQDGRSVVKVGEQTLDLRISTLPTPYGESLVIRILPTKILYKPQNLGLAKRDLDILEALIKKPHGILFVTGPTGSGKTTTLYACLTSINTRERKIITIEDPIEYEMRGITQIQVMPEIGLDFARGLRSMLRHDPDVMMVGEVRDLETAEIAIRVALTGHLVFSTLHTNDAASGITRLIDIGLEPYLVSSSIEAFIAQRLVRVICPHCKYEDTAVAPELKAQINRELKIDPASPVKVCRGKGCGECNSTGFFGRTAIYELLLVDEVIKDMVVKKSPSNRIKNAAIQRGMRTLRQDGWQKVLLGVTTPEEVMKITSAEEGLLPEEAVKVPLQQTPFAPLLAEASGSEKRLYRRLDSRVVIRYKIIKSKDELPKELGGHEYLTGTKNLSAGGLLFKSNQAVPVGAILELKIELPDGEAQVESLTRVLRIEELEEEKSYNIAVCFLALTGLERSRLDRYVESVLS